MAIASLVMLAVSLFFALIISWAIVLPFFQQAENQRGVAEHVQIVRDAIERKERVLQALEDLEQEYLSEKLSEEDYQQSKAELTHEAMACVEIVDRLSGVEQTEGKATEVLDVAA